MRTTTSGGVDQQNHQVPLLRERELEEGIEIRGERDRGLRNASRRARPTGREDGISGAEFTIRSHGPKGKEQGSAPPQGCEGDEGSRSGSPGRRGSWSGRSKRRTSWEEAPRSRRRKKSKEARSSRGARDRPGSRGGEEMGQRLFCDSSPAGPPSPGGRFGASGARWHVLPPPCASGRGRTRSC